MGRCVLWVGKYGNSLGKVRYVTISFLYYWCFCTSTDFKAGNEYFKARYLICNVKYVQKTTSTGQTNLIVHYKIAC